MSVDTPTDPQIHQFYVDLRILSLTLELIDLALAPVTSIPLRKTPFKDPRTLPRESAPEDTFQSRLPQTNQQKHFKKPPGWPSSISPELRREGLGNSI